MHVIVIGAGILGLSVSHHLVKRGIEVTAIDRIGPAALASSTTFACINYFNYWQEPYFTLRRNSIDYARELAAQLDISQWLHLQGTLRWGETPDSWEKLERSVKALLERGVQVESFSPADVRRHLEPDLNVDGIARDIVRIPNEGWMDGAPFVGGLLAAAQASGRFNWKCARVTGLQTRTDSVTVRTDHGAIDGDVVVLAAGVDTGSLAAMLGMHLSVKSDPGTLFVSHYLPSKLSHTCYAGHLHFRPDGAGRIMAGHHGGEFPSGCTPGMEAQLIAEQLSRRVPALRNLPPHAVLVGMRPVPEDGLPVLGFIREQPRAYVFTCHSGMTLGCYLGKLASQEILGDPVKQLSPYRPERFGAATAAAEAPL